MTASIHDPKVGRRAQQLAQKHLDFQAAAHDKRPRPTAAADVFANSPTHAIPAPFAQSHRVNARTLLTAGTFLALLTGGQAAAALADGAFTAPPALAPNRRARRMLQLPAAVPPPPPPVAAQSTVPALPLDLLTRVLQGPPPYNPADMVAFMRGATTGDFYAFLQAHPLDSGPLIMLPCAPEVARILATTGPLSDADILLVSRAATGPQLSQMQAQRPDFGLLELEVNAHWPSDATFPPPPAPPPPAPPPPAVPAGPPVTLLPAGKPDATAFLKTLATTPAQFTTGAGPLRLVGYNVASPGTTPCTIPLSDFATVCDTIASNGGNAVRLFGFQSMGGPLRWQNFDDAIATARARSLKIIWVLGNQWGNCENIEPGTAPDGYKQPAWYTTGYQQAGGGNLQSYRDFALATVSRYKDEPTIAMWTLLNEAEAGTVVAGTTCPNEQASTQAMSAFVADMASAIRARAPKHLLSLGTRGQADNCGLQGDHYLSVQAPVDVLTLHSYGISYARAQNVSAMARAAGKPLIMSEHAHCADDLDCSGSSEPAILEKRACEMEKLAVGFAGLGIVGELPWHLQGPTPAATATATATTTTTDRPTVAADDGYSLTATDPLIARLKKFAAGGTFAVDEVC